jgi:hypothetical protein
MSYFTRRAAFQHLLGFVVACLLVGPASALSPNALAYVPVVASNSAGWLIDWTLPGRATLISAAGRRDGTVRRIGQQRVVTLDTPFSVQFFSGELDCNGLQPELRQDTLQVAVERTAGTATRGESSVVELGTITTLTGCDAGRVEPFGSLSGPGLATSHLAMNLRPSVADLLPGVALAGVSEEPRFDDFPAVDVMTVQAGGLALFTASGSVLGLSVVDGWQVLALPSGERAYARIFVDRKTGAETWLDADWAAGEPTSVRARLMVKPVAGASFGGVRQASREWESGLFIGSPSPFFIYLYTDRTGERVNVDTATGTETRSPITWQFSGANIVQRRTLGGGTGQRTWQPLRSGGGATFVIESEIVLTAGEPPYSQIKPRINFYNDMGPAAPLPGRR